MQRCFRANRVRVAAERRRGRAMAARRLQFWWLGRAARLGYRRLRFAATLAGAARRGELARRDAHARRTAARTLTHGRLQLLWRRALAGRCAIAKAAKGVQRAWRGRRARERVLALRGDLAAARDEAARQKAKFLKMKRKQLKRMGRLRERLARMDAYEEQQRAQGHAVGARNTGDKHLDDGGEALRRREREFQKLMEFVMWCCEAFQRGGAGAVLAQKAGAVALQCFARTLAARRTVARAREFARLSRAALFVQCAWRQRTARKVVRTQRVIFYMHDYGSNAIRFERNRAAVGLQKLWRGILARRYVYHYYDHLVAVKDQRRRDILWGNLVAAQGRRDKFTTTMAMGTPLRMEDWYRSLPAYTPGFPPIPQSHVIQATL